MDYSYEPSFKNPAWKEKKLESKQNRHRGRAKATDEGESSKKQEKNERCRLGITESSR